MKKMISSLLAALMMVSSFPFNAAALTPSPNLPEAQPAMAASAPAAENTTYWNGSALVEIPADATTLDAAWAGTYNENPVPLTSGTYKVTGDVTVSKRITLARNAAVSIILMDGAHLYAQEGIEVRHTPDGSRSPEMNSYENRQTLNLYSQSEEVTGHTGKLTAEGISKDITVGSEMATVYSAGIGGTAYSKAVPALPNIANIFGQAGTISIYGGIISATGSQWAAGIGGAGVNADLAWSGSDMINIYGGEITATGGDSGAGIGSGYAVSYTTMDYAEINIHGGKVTATGGSGGAGIGGGGGYKGHGGHITLSDGEIIARGGNGGAGIGGGNEFDRGDIYIRGGSITAIGGSGSAGIGNGRVGNQQPQTIQTNFANNDYAAVYAQSDPGISTITGINNSPQDALALLILKNDVEDFLLPTNLQFILKNNFTVPAGVKGLDCKSLKMTVNPGVTFTSNSDIVLGKGGTLTNHGTITGSGNITVNGTLTNHGAINSTSNIALNANGILTNESTGTLTNNGTITNNGTLISSGTLAGSGTMSGTGKSIKVGSPTEDNIAAPQGVTASVAYRGTAYGKETDFKLDAGHEFGQAWEFEGWTGRLTKDGQPITEIKDVGQYTITFSKEGCTPIAKSFTVTPAAIAGDVNNVELVYNGKDQTVNITSLTTAGGQPLTIKYGTAEGTYNMDAISAKDTVAAKTYYYKATAPSHTDRTGSFTVTVKQAATVFTGGIKAYHGAEETTSFTYGDTITVKAKPEISSVAARRFSLTPPATRQMALFVGGTQISDAVNAGPDGIYEMTVSTADVAAKLVPGKTTAVTAKFVGDANMADTAAEISLTVNKATPTEAMFTVADTVYTYDNTEHKPTVTLKAAYADQGVGAITVTSTATNVADSKAIAISVAEGPNYEAKTITFTQQLTIEARDISTGTDVVLGTALTFNGEAQTQTISSVKNNNLTVTYDVTGNAQKDADTYTMTITGTGNFVGSIAKEFTIAPHAALDLTAEVKLVRRAPGYEQKVTLSGISGYPADAGTGPVITMETPALGEKTTAELKNGVLKLVADDTAATGIYTVVINLTGMKNYADSKITVRVQYADKTPVTVSGITVADRVYNGQTIAYTGTPTAKVGDQTVTPSGYTYTWQRADGTLLNAAPTDAGDYKLVVAVKASDARYTGSETITFSIKKAVVTITADDKTAHIGKTQPANTYTVAGLLGNDQLTGTVTFTDNASNMNTVGTYTITPAGGNAGENYTIQYKAGKLTVEDHSWSTEWSKDETNHWHECFVCGVHKDETAHIWKAPEFVFTADGKTATAKTSCACGQTHEEAAVVSSEITIPATCTVMGTTTYTAKVILNGTEYTQTTTRQDAALVPGNHSNQIVKVDAKTATCTESGIQEHYKCTGCGKLYWDVDGLTEATLEEVTVKATGHKWSEPVITFSEDGKTATAVVTCVNDSNHTESPKAVVTSQVKIAPTCEGKGTTAYTATVELNHNIYTATKDVEDIAATGHNWREPTYVWAADGSSCTAKRVCKTDGTHSEEATATISSFQSKAPTCMEEGNTTYTAKFDAVWAVEQTKVIADIAAIGHEWSEPVFTFSEDGKTATAVVTCENDKTHTQSLDAKVTSQVKTPATQETMGITTYTAAVTFEGKSYTATKDVQDIPKVKPAETVEKVESQKLETVPESLKDTEFNTVEKIKKAMEKVVLQKIGEQNTGNEQKTILFDAVLMIIENGITRPATPEEVEARGGITVVIPYPTGTNRNDFVFTVAHMLTVDMAGMRAGDIEMPAITLTDAGLKVTLKGLSPVMVGYSRKSAPAEPTVPETTEPATPGTPETGDNAHPIVWIGVMVLAVVCIAALVLGQKNKKRNKSVGQ